MFANNRLSDTDTRPSDTTRTDTDASQAMDVASKVNYLFDRYRNPKTGRQYTYKEVEEGTKQIDPQHYIRVSYLSKLRNGLIAYPSMQVTKLLAAFFDVHSNFWYKSIEEYEAEFTAQSIVELPTIGLRATALTDTELQQMIEDLTPEDRQAVAGIIQRLRKGYHHSA